MIFELFVKTETLILSDSSAGQVLYDKRKLLLYNCRRLDFKTKNLWASPSQREACRVRNYSGKTIKGVRFIIIRLATCNRWSTCFYKEICFCYFPVIIVIAVISGIQVTFWRYTGGIHWGSTHLYLWIHYVYWYQYSYQICRLKWIITLYELLFFNYAF